jgi:hypothetical protein
MVEDNLKLLLTLYNSLIYKTFRYRYFSVYPTSFIMYRRYNVGICADFSFLLFFYIDFFSDDFFSRSYLSFSLLYKYCVSCDIDTAAVID